LTPAAVATKTWVRMKPLADIAGRVLIPLGAAAVFVPAIATRWGIVGGYSPAVGLLAGVAIALTVGNPFLARTKKWTRTLLAASVVGLGAGMNLTTVAKAGLSGLGYTLGGILLCFGAGLLLARLLSVSRDLGILLTTGTAICGGSAIAAIAPVLGADEHEVSVSLAVVFLLNAVGLLVFPILGHRLGMDEVRFGLWAAVAIHDTSSVVGAASAYGPKALEIATCVKLARALWIVPLTIVIGLWRARARDVSESGATTKPKPARPWFILGFVIAAALVTYVPALAPAGVLVAETAKRALVVTLFLIGANLTRTALASVGLRPLAMAIVLWGIMASASLGALSLGLMSSP
jgi:uncharacterized integral membrane protein (TIGR00698 family)